MHVSKEHRNDWPILTDNYTSYISTLFYLFQNALALVDLAMSYHDSSSSFSRQLSRSMPPLSLTAIDLTYTETRYRYLGLYIDNCCHPLRGLRLAYMTFTKPGDHESVLNSVLEAFKLTSCVLMKINVAGNGVDF
jgi:hypothetical protein